MLVGVFGVDFPGTRQFQAEKKVMLRTVTYELLRS